MMHGSPKTNRKGQPPGPFPRKNSLELRLPLRPGGDRRQYPTLPLTSTQPALAKSQTQLSRIESRQPGLCLKLGQRTEDASTMANLSLDPANTINSSPRSSRAMRPHPGLGGVVRLITSDPQPAMATRQNSMLSSAQTSPHAREPGRGRGIGRGIGPRRGPMSSFIQGANQHSLPGPLHVSSRSSPRGALWVCLPGSPGRRQKACGLIRPFPGNCLAQAKCEIPLRPQCEEVGTLKEYFNRKARLSQKYQDLLDRLKIEEATAIDLAAKQASDRVCIIEVFNGIKAEYQNTAKLLLEQRLVEEEELLLHYNGGFKSLSCVGSPR
jgi:hypothetical protein